MGLILVIDDDIELCELLADYLQPEGFLISAVHDGREGLHQALTGGAGLVVLDVMLPDMGGFDVLHRIRSSSAVPVIMLTARGEDIDRIVGLEMGADDYLAKPFNPRELLARIRAILRRSELLPKEGASVRQEKVILDDLSLDPGARSLVQSGRMVELTTVEFSLLHELVKRAGEVVSREELSIHVLERKFSSFDRSIDVHVSSLRKKLGHTVDQRERIKTIRGVGYLYTQASV